VTTETSTNEVELTPETTPAQAAAVSAETPTHTPKKKNMNKRKQNGVKAKSGGKRIKEPKKAKRVAGEKAQTQVDKHLSKWLNATAKEKTKAEGEKIRRADIIRQALIKGAKSLGYKAEA
jgi:hypothetical protein